MSLLLALCLMLPVAALAEKADPTNTPEVTAEVTAEPTTEAETETATEPETESEADAPAVNYFATLKLKDLYGNDFDASVFDGKPAMLNIWTDWCGYCLEEMPALNRLAETYKDKITLVGLYPEGVTVTQEGAVELVQDKIDAGLAVYEDLGITYPSLLPDMSLLYQLYYSELQVKGYPTTWFVGADGMIYHIETSAHTEEEWITLMDAVLEYMEEQGVAAAP